MKIRGGESKKKMFKLNSFLNFTMINYYIRLYICSLYEAVSVYYNPRAVSRRQRILAGCFTQLSSSFPASTSQSWDRTDGKYWDNINFKHFSPLRPSGPAQCETIAGDQCLFPFTYQGRTYYSCTVEDSDNGSPWCAVQVRPGPRRTVMPGKWDDCSPDCPGYDLSGFWILVTPTIANFKQQFHGGIVRNIPPVRLKFYFISISGLQRTFVGRN